MPSLSSPSQADQARPHIMVGVMFRSRLSERQGDASRAFVMPPQKIFRTRVCAGNRSPGERLVRRSSTSVGGSNSDFPKSCQGRESKIFRFRSHPNQPHNSTRLTADEGRWPSSRTRGEMRWTRELRLTCAAQAYGEVVWS